MTLNPFGTHDGFRSPRLSRYLLVAGLALSAIAIACSGGGDEDETATPQPTTAAAPTVAATSATDTSVPAPTATPRPVVARATATAAPTATAQAAPAQTPRPTAISAQATATPGPPTATPSPASTPVPTPTQDPFAGQFLAFDAPEFFDDVSEVPTYTIIGRTRIDAFVTINDQIVDIDENGRFILDVQLEEGINIFEVVSSVSDTESLDEVLTVIYAP